MDLSARYEAGLIDLAGSRDTALEAPSLPWAVADHGMDDQLLPLIRAAGFHRAPQRLAIYRPLLSR